MLKRKTCLYRVTAVEECDARDDERSYGVGNKIKKNPLKNKEVVFTNPSMNKAV